MPNPLDGIRVIELARFQAGPRAGLMLSDLGAEVIKVEKPGGEETRQSPPMVDGQSVYFSVYNRGKKSICLDLRRPEGREVLRDLVRTADIVLENFRPGVIEEMGFGYSALKAVKPDIILLSVSGFGQYGPYRDRPAFDPVGQAMSGLMTLTGQLEGKPIGTASSIVDHTTSLHAAIGALAALRQRDSTGEGQAIDVSLYDAALSMVDIPTSYYLATGREGGEGGRPPYRAKDGWVVILPSGRAMNRRLLEAIGVTDGPAGPDAPPGEATRVARRAAIAGWCAARTVAEIGETMERARIPYAPVLSTPEVARDPQLWARELLVKMPDPIAGEMYLPGLVIKASGFPGHLGPVPAPGQHTEEVLRDLLGYDAARTEALRAQGII